MKGVLITVLGETVFRVYNAEYEDGFRDYELRHHDLAIEIVEEDMQISYDANSDNHYIDYSDKTLLKE